jgi:hypothetical protein
LRGADTRPGNADEAARFGRLVRDGGIEIVELLQQRAGFAVVRLARLRQAQLARRAVHQPHSEIILEVGHILAEQCLGASMLARCRRKTTGIEDLNEGTDAGEILRHGTPFTLAT